MKGLKCPVCNCHLEKIKEDKKEIGTAFCEKCNQTYSYRWISYNVNKGYKYIIKKNDDRNGRS